MVEKFRKTKLVCIFHLLRMREPLIQTKQSRFELQYNFGKSSIIYDLFSTTQTLDLITLTAEDFQYGLFSTVVIEALAYDYGNAHLCAQNRQK